MTINIGDTVHIIGNAGGVFDIPVKCVVRYKVHNTTIEETVYFAYEENNSSSEHSFSDSDIGCTVFITEEDANAILPEAKCENVECLACMAINANEELCRCRTKLTKAIKATGVNLNDFELNSIMWTFLAAPTAKVKIDLLNKLKSLLGAKHENSVENTASWIFDDEKCLWRCSSCSNENKNLGWDESVNPYEIASAAYCPCCGKKMSSNNTDKEGV